MHCARSCEYDFKIYCYCYKIFNFDIHGTWSFLSFQIDIYGFYIHLIGERTLNQLRANQLTLNQYQLITQIFNHAEILSPAKYKLADI